MAVLLPALVLSFGFSPSVRADVARSLHNFSAMPDLAPGGMCTPCHRIHYAGDSLGIWSRELDDERDYFDETSNPDYVPATTLSCYDCHVDYATGGTLTTPDEDPDDGMWAFGNEPQDIAFSDGPGGDVVGFYEVSDDGVPGGHYWKSEPAGAPEYAEGDKLPCTMCHDPHDQDTGDGLGKNEAMFLMETSDGTGKTITLGARHKASSNSRNGSGDGRSMCAACHGYSDQPTSVTMWDVLLPSPQSGVAGHLESSSRACTDCHAHNFITPPSGCVGCHGYPPMSPSDLAAREKGDFVDGALEDYAGGGEGHDAADHLDGAVAAVDGWAPCLKCHPSGSHGSGGEAVIRSNVDVEIDEIYDAQSGRASFTSRGSAAEAFCSSVSCHGGQDTPVWEGGAISVSTDCVSCHAAEESATEYNSAVTGLHAREGRVSLENHTEMDSSIEDIQDSNLCTHCHLEPSSHLGVTLDTVDLDALTEDDFVTDWDGTGGNVSASGCKVTCHSDTQEGVPRWVRRWSSTVTADDGRECANCHGDFRNGWVDGIGPSHDLTDLNRTSNHMTCAICHVYDDGAYDSDPLWDGGSGSSNHGNGLITMNSELSVNYNEEVIGCDGGICHLNDDEHRLSESSWEVELIDGPAASCAGCHGYPPMSEADLAARREGGEFVDGTIEDYAGGGEGHDRVNHLPWTVTASDGWEPCLKCHPDRDHNSGGGTVIRSNVDVEIDGTYDALSGSASFTPGRSAAVAFCSSVSCHGGQDTPFWEGGAITMLTDCRSCHVVEETASEYNSAVTGLHGRAGRVSLENHTETDDSLGDIQDSNLCTHCHLEPSSHLGATLDTEDLDALTDADFVTDWDGRGGNISASGCKVTCHSDTQGGAPKWVRLWSTTVRADDGRECANCHGDFGDGWVAGVEPSHDLTGLKGTANHMNCAMCHVYDDGDYDFDPLWDGGRGRSNHGNGSITMNSDPTVDYNEAIWGCDGGTCHSNNVSHQLSNSAWEVEFLDGPMASCTNCHGFPPMSPSGLAGRAAGEFVDGAAEDYAGGGEGHDTANHLDGTVAAADGWTPCLKCHPAVSHSMGGETVSRSNVDVEIDETYDAQSGSASFTPGRSAAAAFCSRVSCHGGQDTPFWDGGTITVSADCGSCHVAEESASEYNSAVTGLHARTGRVSLENHTETDSSLGDNQDSNLCTHCHLEPEDHLGETLDTEDLDALTDDDFVEDWDGWRGYISTSGCQVICHSDTREGVPNWQRLWSPTITADDGRECANCHGDFESGWADGVDPNHYLEGLNATENHGNCKVCHVYDDGTYDADPLWDGGSGTSNHGNGMIAMNSDPTVDYSEDDWSCNGETCHPNDSSHELSDSTWAIEFIDGPASRCEGCHSKSGSGPNVMGDGSNPDGTGRTPKPYDDGTWGFNVNGHGANGTADNNPPGMNANAACVDCHDISDPPGTHLDGRLNSAENGSNTNDNTAHLVEDFIETSPFNEWDVQLTFDDNCFNQCHSQVPFFPDMRHGLSNPNGVNITEFGRAGTVADGEDIDWPIDSDITTNANRISPDFGTCVSCHNPHGTDIDEPMEQTNRMMRETWKTNSNLCIVCH